MTSPAKVSHQTGSRNTTNPNAQNDSLIDKEIDQIEASAQNHNLVIIQKQLNERRWKEMKPTPVEERLYYVDKEHRQQQSKEMEKARAEEISRMAADSEQNEIQGINPHSLALTRKMEGDFLSRTMEWKLKRDEKLEGKKTEKVEEQSKFLNETIRIRSHMNPEVESESRVKAHVDALGAIANHKKQQKNWYGKSPERGGHFGASKSRSPVPRSNRDPIPRIGVKVQGVSVDPSLTSTMPAQSKSPIRIPVPGSEDWSKLKFADFKGKMREAIHN
jgi:hypothetical protein